MSNDANSPQELPLPPDALAHLERMHVRAKENEAAWRKLLEHLEALTKKDTPNAKTDTETPST